MSESADNLGVPNSTLQRWVKQADIDDGNAKKGELTSVAARVAGGRARAAAPLTGQGSR